MTRERAFALVIVGAISASCNAVLGIEEAVPEGPGNGTDGGLGDVVTEAPLTDTSTDGLMGPCDPTKAFAPPTLVPNVNMGQEPKSAQLLPDELTMILSATSFVTGNTTIFSSTRPSITADFSAPGPLAGANSGLVQLDPTVSGDGLTMYFATSRQPLGDGGINFDIYVTTRTTVTSPFQAPFPVDALNTPQAESNPFVAANGTTIYFSSARTGLSAIYQATQLATGTFGVPTAIAELNSGDDRAPVVTADELTIFFGSPRGGGKGGTDIWTARRSSKTAPFSAPTVVSELNAPGDDTPAWVSADRCRIYLVSDRSSDGGLGAGTTIWQSVRPK